MSSANIIQQLNPPLKDARPFQVLALDGGGFRGLFAAQVLAHWEKQLGRPIASCFDLVVGTSTGGIIALGLAAGMSASALVDFYLEDGKTIFPAPWSAWRFVAGARHWFVAKYGSGALEKALQRRFGAMTMGDLQTPVVIPAFHLRDGKHWYFKTPHFAGNLIDYSRPVWEVARATSAAPTYFPGFDSSRSEWFINGGVLANNPSLVGYLEVFLNFSQWSSRIKILNIGTEGAECALPPSRLHWGGLLVWAKRAPDILMQTQAASSESLMARLLGDEAWLRIKPEHGRGFAPLDLYTPQLYLGMAASESARRFPEVQRLFFHHDARTGLVQRPAA